MPTDKQRKGRRGKRGRGKNQDDQQKDIVATEQQQQQQQKVEDVGEDDLEAEDMFMVDTEGQSQPKKDKKSKKSYKEKKPKAADIKQEETALPPPQATEELNEQEYPYEAEQEGYQPPEFNDNYYYGGDGGYQEEGDGSLHPASYGILNPDLQSYIKNCENMLDDPPFETAEDLDGFLANMYEEIKEKEVIVMTDHECSRILEKLLRVSSDYQIRQVMSRINGKVPELIIHRFASHVLQTLATLCVAGIDRELRGEYLGQAPQNNDSNDNENGDEKLPTYEDMVIGMTRELEPHWSFMISDPYASHVIQVLLLLLANMPQQLTSSTNNGSSGGTKSSIRSKKSIKYAQDNNSLVQQAALLVSGGKRNGDTVLFKVPDSFKPLLLETLTTINDSLNDIIARSYISHASANLVLQQILKIQAKENVLEIPGGLLDKLLRGIITEENPEKDSRRDMANELTIKDPVGSHFIQVVLETCSSGTYRKLYSLYFKDKIKSLAFHPSANFVVQSLMTNVKTKEQLKGMLQDIAPLLKDLIIKGRAGVARSLMLACTRLNACYQEMVDAICQAFEVATDVEKRRIVPVIAYLILYKDYDPMNTKNLRLNIQGSLIIQDWAKFPEPQSAIVAQGLIGLPIWVLCEWATNPVGSRIVEAILKSPTVPLKLKRKIVLNFMTHYAEIGCNKYGSHIVDACWNEAGDIVLKEKMIKEFIENEAKFQDSLFGRFILRNCRLESYKRSPKEWSIREKGYEKRKEMFKDILEDGLATSGVNNKEKRKSGCDDQDGAEDEIDQVFKKAKTNKSKDKDSKDKKKKKSVSNINEVI
ncbi:Nucleolar protein 9 [Mycoemilia scoparia]|uniref:Nucleolar protein 9 n=1 Tax=Mycoemilia scoparia TaxID=417184 RepID=A0A9W7ZMS8_9FUNG|nr:Nucleolar protein 9 [Mycoemilia scoparia]